MVAVHSTSRGGRLRLSPAGQRGRQGQAAEADHPEAEKAPRGPPQRRAPQKLPRPYPRSRLRLRTSPGTVTAATELSPAWRPATQADRP
eukprot:8025196-Alexandrium_andersonii.AAC.1